MSDNKLTGTSLEVLSFISSGIKKRTGSEYSDGRPGRINYHSEDEYRTITLLVQSTAYDMQDVAHLRDAVNELFDGELMIREMRIKSAEVEYESMGQRTGELQLESPEYVNGKQIKVAMVNSPEIDDTTIVSTFTVEFETTESPYFETIYTTLELHDSGYSATAEKYGLVDNIDDEKVKYRFTPSLETVIPTAELFEQGNIHTGRGDNLVTTEHARSKGFFQTLKGSRYTLNLSDTTGNSSYIRIYNYNSDGSYISDDSGMFSAGNEYTFTAIGDKIRLVVYPASGKLVKASDIGVATKIYFEGYFSNTHTLNVYNAGNVTIEPESMMLNIELKGATSSGNLSLKNITTGEEFKLNKAISKRNVKLEGINVTENSINVFRDTNRHFISLAPGDNRFEVTGATFDELSFEFKNYYK